MAVEMIFKTNPQDEVQKKLTLFATKSNKIYIEIEPEHLAAVCIHLDKETSIKLAKELRKQISFLED